MFSLLSPALAFADLDSELEERRILMEILRTAPPMPFPPAPKVPPTARESASADQRGIEFHDLTTGETAVIPRESLGAAASGAEPSGDRIDPPFIPPHVTEAEPSEGREEKLIPRINPSPVTAVFDTTSYPWNTIHKIMMRFEVGGVNRFSVCSAMAVSPFHVLTAGHCVYNRDPNGDGDTSDRRWADEVWVWAAHTDRASPVGLPDMPYGEAKGIHLRTYTGWTQNGNWDHDWALVTLDRRDGDHTGWMGRSTGTTSSLHFSGYPTERPYVPSGTDVQWHGFDPNNVVSFSSSQIAFDGFVYGGHSGGPSWRTDGASRYIHGIHSRSDREGSAWDTRLTNGKMEDMNRWISDDEGIRPPVARPDLIEHVFDSNARKDLLTNVVEQGDPISVEYNVFNAGFAPSGTFTVRFYLSTDLEIDGSDRLIGTRTHSLNAWSYTNPTATLTVPSSVPADWYYVGWTFSGGVPEYYTGDNSAVIGHETLRVNAASGDGYEPNGSRASATPISPLNAPQTHALAPVGDVDYVTFTLSAPASSVTIATSGASGDTSVQLFRGLFFVAQDDDGGPGHFSRITRGCGADALVPGTYYVRVQEDGHDQAIPTYQISVDTEECVPGECSVSPMTSCVGGDRPGSSFLLLKKGSTPKSNLVTWRFAGDEASTALLGDPVNSDAYRLCVYQGADLIFGGAAPAGGLCNGKPCWRGLGKPAGEKGYRYTSPARSREGILKMIVKPGDRARAIVKGKGEKLVLPELPLSNPEDLTVQLQLENGECFSGDHTSGLVVNNSDRVFKGKGS